MFLLPLLLYFLSFYAIGLHFLHLFCIVYIFFAFFCFFFAFGFVFLLFFGLHFFTFLRKNIPLFFRIWLEAVTIKRDEKKLARSNREREGQRASQLLMAKSCVALPLKSMRFLHPAYALSVSALKVGLNSLRCTAPHPQDKSAAAEIYVRGPSVFTPCLRGSGPVSGCVSRV